MRRIFKIAIVAFTILSASVYAADEVTIDGFDPNGSSGLMTPYQQLSNQESVNLTNGTMARQWTEAVVPGRAGMDLRLTRTLAAGKTEIVVEEFNGVFSSASSNGAKKITGIRYKDATIEIPTLGKMHAISTSTSHNKVTYDPQNNGWDVSWAMFRGIVVMSTVGSSGSGFYYVFLVHPGGELEKMDGMSSSSPGSNNMLMTTFYGQPSSLIVMGNDGREYTFEIITQKDNILYYDADYVWRCGGFLWFKDDCNETITHPRWRIDGYILKEVKDAFGNKVVATTPSAGVNEALRLEMQLVSVDPMYSNIPWKTVERRIFQDHEDWVVEPGEKQRLWRHDRDENGRFTTSTTPGKRVTTIEYDAATAFDVYPKVRRLGLDYLKTPDSFVQIKYPTGGLVRYEYFGTLDEPENSLTYAIVTEIPALKETQKFYQKYYRISKTNTDKPDQPFITTDINTSDGAQIHQVYNKLKNSPVLGHQIWTANGRVVTADYSYMQDISVLGGYIYGLQTMKVKRDNQDYVHFEGSYDKLGRLISSKDELGREIKYQYMLTDQEFKSQYFKQYDIESLEIRGQLIRKKDLVSVEEKAAGGQAIRLNYEYGGTDSCGGKVDDATIRRVTRQIGSAAPILLYEKCYDVFGNVIREVNGPTQAFGTNIEYDPYKVIKLSETDSEGHLTKFNIDPDTGWLTYKKTDNGVSEAYIYDGDGRIKTAEIGSTITENTYDDSPSGNAVTTKTTDSITKIATTVTRTFDGLGFLTAIDDNGAIHSFDYDAAKRLSGVTYPDGNKAMFVYDGFNRLTLQSLPGQQPVKYNYSLATCSNGAFCDEIATTIGVDATPVAKIRNDLAGRRVSTLGYLGGLPVDTAYQLDTLDGITSIQSPSALSINDSIDYASQTMTRSLPGGDKIQIGKANILGQSEEIEFSDAIKNVKVSFSYDVLFRPTSMDFLNGNEKQNYITMSYGAKGSNADGHLEKVTEASGSNSEFLYGSHGELEGVVRSIKGMTPLKTYAQKDSYGNPVVVVYPNGLSIHYIRDAKNRVTHVRKGNAAGIILAKMAYDVRDNLTSVAYANGITTDYEYDLAGRVTRIASHKGEKYVLDDRYSYDSLGNKISVTHQDGSKASYDYDGLNRLTQAKYFKKLADTPYDVQEYAYDVDGNRTSYKDSIKEIQYVMEEKDGKRISNRVASYTVSQKGKLSITVQFEYALGNLVKQTESQNGVAVLTKTFVYDPNNRLIKATVKDDRTGFQTDSEYSYDYAGRREQVTVNGAKSYYGYGESLDPLVRVNEKNEIEAAYIYVGSRRLGVIEGDTLSFFHTDELGNTLKTSDDTGAVTQTVRYDPFGNVNFLNGPSENRYLYAGKPYDEATGLIYFGARYYDPQLGRFISRDPAGQGFNHYIYTDNNPLIRQEIYGMSWFGGFDWLDMAVSMFLGDVKIPFISAIVHVAEIIVGKPRDKDPTFRGPSYSDVTGGGNSVGGRAGYGCGGPTGICPNSTPPPSSGPPPPKAMLTNATSFGIAQAGGKSILPNTDISGRSTLGSQKGATNTEWKDFLKDLYKVSTNTIKKDINSNKNYSNVSSLQNSAKQSETVRSTIKVMDDANRTIPKGNTPTAPGDAPNFIALQQGNIVAANMTDTTDKGSPGVQENQAQNNTKAGTNAAGDPVLLHSGDLLQSEIDLNIPGRGVDYEFRRTYRSRIQFDGPLGANWDHNYNKRLVTQENGDIARFDGDARFDIYKHNEDGTYTTPSGRFDVLSKLPDGTYQIRDRHGVFYRYNGVGIITSITDSNNNSLNFEYIDVAGASRLTKVTDTLGRAIQYQYYTSGPAIGHLQKVTDFAGRTVQFAIDGNLDLVAVTSPATSDFPAGKKVQYSYSSGFAEDQTELNHNLVKVTDAKGQVVLQNTYSLFDRVLTQRLGPMGQFQFDYHPLTVVVDCTTPETLAQAAYRTTVTNRAQNQTVYDFNCQGNPLTIQNFTRGVRPADPAAYVTHYTYNKDGLPTTVTHPDGNQVQLIYADVQGLPKTVAQWSVGNLMAVRRVPDAKRGGGSPIETDYQYELLYNKPVAMTDPRGNITRIWYDYQEGLTVSAAANLLGVDVAAASPLFPSGLLGIGDVNGDGVTTQTGGNVVGIDLPKAKDPDGVVQQLAMRFRYNTAGQITRMIDAAGTITDYAYQDGYLSKVTSDAGGLGITRSMTRDAVGNVTSASDGSGQVTQFEVNALNQITKLTDPLGHFTQFSYDANNNVVQIDRQNLDETGAVANGNPLVTTKIDYNVLNRPTLQRSFVAEGKFVVTEFQYDANENLTRVVQPEGNSTFIQYDERDLPYQVVRGYGSADASRTVYRYNGSGKPTQIQDPLDHLTTITYDGFDRPILTTDALGNTAVAQYDPADQMTQVQRRGPPTVGGDVTTVLWERKMAYDELGRATGITEGSRNTKLYYNFQNQLAKQVDPQGRVSNFIYDPVGRLLQQILPNGDKSIATYDGEGRILTQVQQQTHAALGMQTFATQYAYDAAGRLTQRTTPDSAVWKYQYDSLGRLRVVVDPTDITHSNSFDDLGRLISSSADNTTTGYTWDDDSRLTAVTDAKGNKTAYTFDALNRRTQVQFADGSIQSVIYSAVSQPTQIKLPNGFAVNMAFDAGNQLLSRIIAKDAANVGKETFGYDGLGRMISGKVLDANGATQDDLALKFDDLGALLQATQNSKTIQSTFTAGGDRQSVTYPGGIDLALTHDPMGRLTQLGGGSLGQLQATTYAGGLRPYQITTPNGVAATLGYDIGARIKDLNWAKGATKLAQHAYSYNALSNIVLDNTPSNVGDLFQYDTQGRLTQASQKVPNAPNFVGKTPAQFGAQYEYSYDAVSNWTQQTAKPANTTTAYTANTLNQYTKAGTADLKYDKNGNLTQDETFTYAYDWRNLITEVRTTADNAVVAQYRYDALGRRVTKVDGLSNDVTRYVLDGWNVVEERDNSGAVAASYVYDERGLPIAMQRSGKLYFYQYNHLGSIESVTNSDGDVVEQYQYDPFGGVTVADGAGNALPSSQIDNPFFFAGQWRDSESGLYYMRHRYYSASLGRFTTRDPLEYIDGLNAYAYAMSNPVNFSDPLGLSTSAGGLNTGAGNPQFNGDVLGYVKDLTAVQYQISRNNWASAQNPFTKVLYGFNTQFYGLANLLAPTQEEAFAMIAMGHVGAVGYAESRLTHVEKGIVSEVAEIGSHVFWSGNRGANRVAAEAFAQMNGKLTLEMTPGAKSLPEFSTATRNIWGAASKEFAEKASGEVNAFVGGSRYNSVWNTVERPALMSNPKVNKIIIHDALQPWHTRIIYK